MRIFAAVKASLVLYKLFCTFTSSELSNSGIKFHEFREL